MPEVLRWANAEREVRAWLVPRLSVGSAGVVTETTTTVPEKYVKVERAGGRGDGPLDKLVQIEVAVHARTRGDMWALVGEVETAFAALTTNGTPGMYVDEVEETFAFAADPMPSQDVRRAIATYTLTVRPR